MWIEWVQNTSPLSQSATAMTSLIEHLFCRFFDLFVWQSLQTMMSLSLRYATTRVAARSATLLQALQQQHVQSHPRAALNLITTDSRHYQHQFRHHLSTTTTPPSDEKEKPGFFGRIQNAITSRQERLAQEQFAEQVERMANSRNGPSRTSVTMCPKQSIRGEPKFPA
jgi:hypothetical protein